MNFKDFLTKDTTTTKNLNEELLFEKDSKILNLPKELNGVEYTILGSKLSHFFVKFEESDWKKPLFAKVSYKMKDGKLANESGKFSCGLRIIIR